jgi:hypothetical protein
VMLDEAKEFSESDLVRFFHSLTETEKNLRESAHPRYQLEIGLVKLAEMRRLAALGQIVERLNALEEALRGGRAPVAAGGPSSATPASGSGGSFSRRGGASSGGGSSAAPVPFSTSQTDAGAHGAAPLDLSNTPPANQSPHAGLKLVPPPDERAQVASPSSLSADEPPFSSDGAMRATATGAAPYTSSYEQYQSPPPPLFNPQGGGNGAAAKPQMSAPASSQESGDSWSRPGAGFESDGPVGRIKKALDARRKPFLAVAIEEAGSARVDADEFFVAFTPDKKHLRDTLSKPDNVRLLQEVCRETLGREVGVRIVVREAGESDEAPPSKEEEERREKQALRARAESHPDVQQLLRTFRAEIIEVRRVDGEAQPRPE